MSTCGKSISVVVSDVVYTRVYETLTQTPACRLSCNSLIYSFDQGPVVSKAFSLNGG